MSENPTHATTVSMMIHRFLRAVPLIPVLLVGACAGNNALPPPAPCTDHCTTHTDGYEWAQRGNFTDQGYCEGYPDAFMLGCRNGLEDLKQLRPSSQGI
jgi:hypothetical protein